MDQVSRIIDGPWEYDGSRELILIVDDDLSIRSSLARLLRAEGYAVATEADGKSGIESVHLLKPSLVLLDVMLPDMNGYDVCRELRQDPETRLTPIVLLTGLSGVEDRVKGLDVGADDYVTKPAERAELLARVRSLLRVRRYTDQLERAESVLLALARSIEGKDPCTEGHCERLSDHAVVLGRRLGLGEDELKALDFAGELHDIGKVAVPDAILLKPGPLTPDEWNVIRRHPITGEHICGPIHSFRLVLPIVRHHHEKCDGSGYPDGLIGEEIPLTAKILQVVDVWDALTTARPYKPPLRQAEALETLHSEVERGWWDGAVFQEFRQYLTESPAVLANTRG